MSAQTPVARPTAPLAGVRVLEVANMIAGPSAAALMADLGAEVVKVEPLTGDILRGSVLGDIEPDPWFELDNRGKQGVAVDLDRPEGVDVVHRLTPCADIFITNLTIERQQKFRLTVGELQEISPTLIHASITGYGTTGPEATRLAYDMTAFFARGGIQSLVGEPGGAPPAFRPGQGDHTASLSLLSAILAALRVRDQTGQGQVVEVALLQVAAWTIASDLSATLVAGGPPDRWPRDEWPSPLTCRFRCADERWVALCMPGPRDFWPGFATALGRPEWVGDPRFADPDSRRANAAELIAACDAIFATEPRPVWAQRLDEAALTWAPVQDVDELPDDPQVQALGVLHLVEDHPGGPFHTVNTPFRIRDADVEVRGRAPQLGEHTSAVLTSAGLTAEQISQLIQAGVIAG
ncbi:MAG: CoA transferase [Actinomycetia bacterium]|nr:CoA transferase [Actinomycetes bacterium]